MLQEASVRIVKQNKKEHVKPMVVSYSFLHWINNKGEIPRVLLILNIEYSTFLVSIQSALTKISSMKDNICGTGRLKTSSNAVDSKECYKSTNSCSSIVLLVISSD